MNKEKNPERRLSLRTFQVINSGLCPYLKNNDWITFSFYSEKINPALYEMFMNDGFRRSGYHIYRNVCPDCDLCIPLRVDIPSFTPSRSQKRAMKRNRHLKMTREPAVFRERDFNLYRKYCTARHDFVPGKAEYESFLIETPVPTEMIRYFDGSRLFGISWIDILPDSLSAVYFAFDPDYSKNSPGTFSIYRNVEIGRELGKRWLHLGFWIETSRKMAYKIRFRPCQKLIGKEWVDV